MIASLKLIGSDFRACLGFAKSKTDTFGAGFEFEAGVMKADFSKLSRGCNDAPNMSGSIEMTLSRLWEWYNCGSQVAIS